MAETILIADDDPDLRGCLAEVVGREFSVLEAEDGAQAIELIRKRHPRLVLLDVSMPEVDGLDVLEAARELDPSIIVVMLTSHREMDLAREALRLGAAEYMTKPFDAQAIRSEVARLLCREGEPGPEEPPWRTVH